MSNVTQTPGTSGNVTLSGSSNVKITNLAIPTINIEVAHTLQDNLKQLLVRHRGIADIKYAFVLNESGTNYITIFKRTVETIINLSFTAKVLYLQSDKTGTVEIRELY